MQSVNEFSVDSLKKLVDAADKLSNPSGKGKGVYLNGSISSYTKNLIMTFPCMCDDSLSASTASMISRANERNIVTMLHMLFSSINMSTSSSAIDIIKGIHNNIKSNYNIDDYIDAANAYHKAYGEAVKLDSVHERVIVENMLKQMKEARSFPINSLNESNPISNFEVKGSNGIISVKEKSYDFSDGSSNTDEYAYDSLTGQKIYKGTRTTTSYKSKNYNDKNHNPDDPNIPTEDDLDYEKKANDVRRYERDTLAAGRKDERDAIEKRLLDADVRKANEMQPALMIINYDIIDPDSKRVIRQSSFVAGVKSRLIPVESQDIMERIFAKNKTKINFKNFIRATTGEISFVKDFLLCINQAKIDAKNASKKGLAANMWKTLENRAIKNNFNRIRKEGTNDASAITVLVVSQETVNALNKYYHIDLSKVKAANDLMTTYNLMGIIIADDSLEVAKFLYAGNDMWDQQAYSFLQKEDKDKSYKQVVNLLNKNMM